MSEIDLIILGLIKEQPQGAYELQKAIEYRNISYWVKISTPSIYKNIKKLEEGGYIEGRTEKNGNMPEKSVYSLTDKGEAYFQQAMMTISQKQVNIFLGLNAVVLNLDKVDDQTRRRCIGNIYDQVHNLREHIEGKQRERQHIPKKGQLIIKQQLQLAKMLEEWIIEVDQIMQEEEE